MWPAQIDLSLSRPPPASGAGATRLVNLLILFKPPPNRRVAAQLWANAHMAAISPPATLFFVAPSGGRALAETNNEPACQASHASASSDRPTPTAIGSSARRRLLTARRPRRSRATSGVHRRLPPTAATDAPFNAGNLQAAIRHNAAKEKEEDKTHAPLTIPPCSSAGALRHLLR